MYVDIVLPDVDATHMIMCGVTFIELRDIGRTCVDMLQGHNVSSVYCTGPVWLEVRP